MLRFTKKRNATTREEWIETSLTGKALLSTPLLNKGTAFTQEERETLQLLGKLPQHVETLEEQLVRTQHQYERYTNNLEKYIYLNNLHDKNEILFYKFIVENLAKTLPMIYTPGVSDAVKEFSQEFRQPRGLYISYSDRDKMESIFDNRTHADIDLIAVTDGERVLGIGDQGIGGMDIPIAKLVVYSLCGVDPYKSLPIMLDVGTDNPHLLNDPLYLGWRHKRIRGKEYDDFIEQFITIIHKKFPHSFLHWEDFAQHNARKLLETYRTRHCSFNDDMQGTGVVTLAAILSAVRVSNIPLSEHRIIVFGAGTAGVGIADQLYDAFLREGISPQEARKQFWLIDRQGLLVDGTPNLLDYQTPYVRGAQEAEQWPDSQRDLLSVVKKIKPSILIGASTVRGAFNEEVVRTMASHVAQPIIFPLSNPNENCEAEPESILLWSEGRALVATGSPFPPVKIGEKIIPISQSNNAYSFPGIGIGSMAVRATQVTDNMLWAAAMAICQQSPAKAEPHQPLLVPIEEIPALAAHVAWAVAKQAVEDKVATCPLPDREQFMQENIWKPYYRAVKWVGE